MQLLLIAGRDWTDNWPRIQVNYLRYMNILEYIVEGKEDFSLHNMTDEQFYNCLMEAQRRKIQ